MELKELTVDTIEEKYGLPCGRPEQSLGGLVFEAGVIKSDKTPVMLTPTQFVRSIVNVEKRVGYRLFRES
jgi:hypothetical protein